MKILKKLAVIIIAVAMISSFAAVPVFAEQTEAALILEEMEVLKGTGSGVNSAYRASEPTRYQVAWLFLRLLGREAAAKESAQTQNFGDSATAQDSKGNKLNDENKKMLAYLYANQNLGFRGYTDNTFRPFVSVNAQMYYKVMLVALGYVEGTDFTWDNVFDKAVTSGLAATKPSNAGTFTIDKLAEITVSALRAKIKGGTKTLIDKLVEEEAVAADKAQESGIYRKQYTQALGKVYNLADTSGVGPPEATSYMLPQKYTGQVTIKFDMTAAVASPDASVSFIDSDVVPLYRRSDNSHYYSHHSIMVAMAGTFRAIDGLNWATGPAFTQGTTYHVRIEANMVDHTYKAYVSAEGMAEVQIGETLAFRTRSQVPEDPANEIVPVADDIAMVVVAGAQNNQIYMEKLVITDNTP